MPSMKTNLWEIPWKLPLPWLSKTCKLVECLRSFSVICSPVCRHFPFSAKTVPAIHGSNHLNGQARLNFYSFFFAARKTIPPNWILLPTYFNCATAMYCATKIYILGRTLLGTVPFNSSFCPTKQSQAEASQVGFIKADL